LRVRVRVKVRFSVQVYSVVFEGNAIDVMLTDDQNDNTSLLIDLLLPLIAGD